LLSGRGSSLSIAAATGCSTASVSGSTSTAAFGAVRPSHLAAKRVNRAHPKSACRHSTSRNVAAVRRQTSPACARFCRTWPVSRSVLGSLPVVCQVKSAAHPHTCGASSPAASLENVIATSVTLVTAPVPERGILHWQRLPEPY
jgi:hypothetical protein